MYGLVVVMGFVECCCDGFVCWFVWVEFKEGFEVWNGVGCVFGFE